MSQQQSPDMDESSERPSRSRSNTTTSIKERPRPRSRGSTTSLQSVGVGNAFQPTPPLQPEPMPMNQNQMYPQQNHHAGQPMYEFNQSEVVIQQQHNMQPIQPHPSMGHTRGISHHEIRPNSQHGFQAVQPYPVQYQSQIPGFPMHPPTQMQHMRSHSEQYEGSPAPEDSNNESRKKKGTASNLANDQELRRLLQQYAGKNLPEVASEVQKNEGSGGKSEKAKQVFAMLWLKESCSRSNQSVRRDRVFARYTERCADMRVPTLNPASFGKLVRIIFPNVQTRRLGVRGESKYHYVDLSLNDGDDERQYASSFEHAQAATSIQHERRESTMEANKPVMTQMPPQIERPPSRMTMETADFPAPRILAKPTEPPAECELQLQNSQDLKLDCKYSNTSTIRLPVRGMTPNLLSALPCIRSDMPGTISTYLAMPSANSFTQQAPSPQGNPLELPDIFPYLAGENYDPGMARALFHLYRSYCIDVIDAFRKCKEKPFFNHHSAFNGKMTVPVSRLFNSECLGPWIKECDMRMYKQIIRFLAPLALQNVPDLVWGVFERIASKLVPHLITTFEEKCPLHVVVAKAVPAARFTNLLKKVKEANVATLQLSKMLDDSQQRTQMWLDLMVMVEPDRLLDESVPPPESFAFIQGILKHDLRTIIEPIEGGLVAAAEDDPASDYANFLSEQNNNESGVLGLEIHDQQSGLLEKWISWLESLPQAFAGHHAQCMLNWHTKFWRSMMMQVGQGGAHSYQSWWYLEAFTTQILNWMCEMQGMLLSEEDQKVIDAREEEKKMEAAAIATTAASTQGIKRKRASDADETNVEERSSKQPSLKAPSLARPDRDPVHMPLASSGPEEPTLPEMPDNAKHDDEDTDAEMDEINRGGPLDLPSIHTGLTSPVKLQPTRGNMDMNVAKHIMQHNNGNGSMIDDSGIDLAVDVDDHDESVKEARKFNKRDWLLSSDPVDTGVGAVGLSVMV